MPPEHSTSGASPPARGRVIHVEGATCTVATQTVLVHQEFVPPAPPLGSWVEFCASNHATHPQKLTSPAEPTFASAASDWSWFRSDAGRRFHLVRERSRALQLVRTFFLGRNFLEVDTPAVVHSPGLEAHLEGIALSRHAPPRWLSTSPEFQMKRLLSAGFERIYELARCFRAEEIGRWHEEEFLMLEWYRTFSDMNGVLADTESLVVFLADHLLKQRVIRRGDVTISLEPPWPKLTLREAFWRYANQNLDQLFKDEERFYHVLTHQVEPQLGRVQPIVLVDYPASMASLARRRADAPDIAERFEVYIDGLEICNGYSELVDAAEQRERFRETTLLRERNGQTEHPVDERFMEALKAGLPPTGGNALGLDRIIMLLLGADTVADVKFFPTQRL